MKGVLFVALGGSVGSAGRYIISLLYQRYFTNPSAFPLPTFIANILGCIIIGLLMGYVSKNDSMHNDAVKLLFVTGFCGGFTTFSAFSYETMQLLNANEYAMVLLYVGLSVVLGIASTYFAYSIFK